MANYDKDSSCSCKCWKAESVSLIYGITSAIITGGGIISCIGAVIYFTTTTNYYSHNDIAIYSMIIAAYTAPCLIIFPFTVILVIGVCMKNRKLVLTYFVFGTIQAIIFVTGSIALVVYLKDQPLPAFVLIICLLSAFAVQYAVWKTYKNMKNADEGTIHEASGYELLHSKQVITGVASVIFIGFLVYIVATPEKRTNNESALYLIHLLFLIVPVLIMLLFSGLLIYGVSKKNSNVVLACFIFGIIETLVFVPGAMVLIYYVSIYGGFIGLCLSIIYLVPLIAVIKTYQKYRNDAYRMCEHDVLE